MPLLTFPCEVCGETRTRYCNPKLPRPRFCSHACLHAYQRSPGLGTGATHYTFTPAMDAAIRKAFWLRRGSLKRLAEGDPAFRVIPYYMVKGRAKELGLVRTETHQTWEPDEKAFCLAHYRRGSKLDALVAAMRRRGWHRSKSAIVKMMEHERERPHGQALTLHDVAMAVGIDDHAVARWVDKGWLTTHTHVSARVRLVRETTLRRFCIDHPWEVANGAPDVVWLIALLTDTDVATASPCTPVPSRPARAEGGHDS